MSYLSGEIEVKLRKTDGSSAFVSIPGRDFGLEGGRDWYRDRDDGTWNASFLFISFQEGFDVLVSFAMNGNQTVAYSSDIRIDDRSVLQEEGISSVNISEDNLSLEAFHPPSEDS